MATMIELHGCLEITGIAGDWNYITDKPETWPKIPRISSIQFDPGSADDVLVVNEHKSGGPQRFYARCQDTYDQRCKYYHGARMIPYIPFADCTLSAGHKVTIELWRD